MQWKIFYGDGSTFSDVNGPASLAPPLNVQVIVQVADIAIGRRTISGKSFYWYEPDGQWYGGNQFDLFDYLMRTSCGIVKFGREIPRLVFESILTRAVADPDLLPKVAWEPSEEPQP